MVNIQVQKDRLQKDLVDLARFGAGPGGGLVRPALSTADLEARQWIWKRMLEAGLEVREDEATNIIGRFSPSGDGGMGPCVATGSHIDTVPRGGKFDGALGICAGLEAIRAIRESGFPLPCPLELLIFTDEEGSHFSGTVGSRAMLDLLIKEEIYRSKAGGIPTLADDLRRVGKDPLQVKQAVRSVEEFRVFLEMHIEQGPILEAAAVPIGIVEGIVGIDRYLIHVLGKSGHAGTIPMNLRDDALVKAARIVVAIHEALVSAGPGIVGTIGELRVSPGASNVIAGAVDMTLDLRSRDEKLFQSMRASISEVILSVSDAHLEFVSAKPGVKMNPEVIRAMEISCLERGVSFKRLDSGAGHDAMTFAARGIPTGMILIPCAGGKSHCPEEDIKWEDAASGAQILADTMVRLACATTADRSLTYQKLQRTTGESPWVNAKKLKRFTF